MIKRDPGGYKHEFQLQYKHYEATRDIFLLQPSKNSKEFADLVMFIAQVSHCYPEECKAFRGELMDLLEKHATTLDAMLRRSLVQALILVRNRGLLTAQELLPLLFKLFRCQDKLLRKQIFNHISSSVSPRLRFLVRASYLQIYNEKVTDLLDASGKRFFSPGKLANDALDAVE